MKESKIKVIMITKLTIIWNSYENLDLYSKNWTSYKKIMTYCGSSQIKKINKS